MRSKEIAAFIYQIKRGRIYIVLVTSRKSGRWILPKGRPEFRIPDKKVALLEAYEEAGIKGSVNKNIKREKVKFQTRRKGNIKMKVYPIVLEKLLTDWPEKRFRKRILVEVEQALRMVRKKALRRCIKVMSAKVLAKTKNNSVVFREIF